MEKWAIILNPTILDFVNDTGLILVSFQTRDIVKNLAIVFVAQLSRNSILKLITV